MRSLPGMLCCLALVTTLPAHAHHAGAMFDDQKSVTLVGTVREFQFTNPHSYIQLVVPGEAGAMSEWTVEMGAPSHLMRHGWKRSSLKAGDRLSVVVHPLRDGGRGGLYVSATGSDGKPIGES